MSAQVICFREAKQRLRGQELAAFEECSASANGGVHTTSISNRDQFEQEYQYLIENLKTRDQKYRHPTIMGGYRKTINPVDALYQNLQEVLFKYDENNEFCVWMISLFKDRDWLFELLCDLEDDCKAISAFQKKHYRKGEDYKLENLYVLQNIKSNFQHYTEVFKMMKSCRY